MDFTSSYCWLVWAIWLLRNFLQVIIYIKMSRSKHYDTYIIHLIVIALYRNSLIFHTQKMSFHKQVIKIPNYITKYHLWNWRPKKNNLRCVKWANFLIWLNRKSYQNCCYQSKKGNWLNFGVDGTLSRKFTTRSWKAEIECSV